MRTYQLEQAGLTDTGNVRAVNEDYLLAEGDLFLVADGMGGHGHGEVASRLAAEHIQAAFATDPTEAGLVTAVKKANTAVYEHPETDSPDAHMGTTVAAVALVVDGDDEYLSVVNVGDSRVYLLRDDQLTRLSMDHSRVAELVRAGALSDDEAAVHPERHILTMAVGVGPEVDPFATRTKPQIGDRVLLCSDGLFNELTGSEIASVLSTVTDAEQATAELVAIAKDHGGNDNITAMVVDIS